MNGFMSRRYEAAAPKQTQASCDIDPEWSSSIDAPNHISNLTIQRLC